MATPKYKRPTGAYAGQANLPNRQKYQNDETNGVEISAEKVDGDINYVVDSLNALNDDVNTVAAAAIPGASVSTNINKFPVTDGAGTITWSQVTNAYVSNFTLGTDKLASQDAGSILSWDSAGLPVLIPAGSDGDVLVSQGGVDAPFFDSRPIFSKNGDTMLGALGLYSSQSGTYQFADGTGDGASYGTYNITWKINNGVGLVNADDVQTGYIDFENGRISVADNYYLKNAGGSDTEGAVLPATSAEMVAASAANRAVTPANIADSPYALTHALLIDGSATTLNSLGSISASGAAGVYAITFGTAFASANDYFVMATAQSSSALNKFFVSTRSRATTGFTIDTSLDTGVVAAPQAVNILIFSTTKP